MPKSAAYTLIWVPEQDCYVLYEQDRRTAPLLQGDDDTWFAWLAEYTSFSFQGKAGQLNLLKEARVRGGEGYWYAYHRQGKRMHKKYAGRSRNLTTARLESLAQTLCSDVSAAGDHEGRPYHIRRAAAQSVASASSLASQPPESLLEPKLRLPRLHASLVERSRLFALLDAGWERKLTLLSAPAGFGKTTLARQWIANRSTQNQIPSVAWVSLDTGDNDPVRFWRYVITACRFLQADSGQAALSLLSTASRPPFNKSLSLEDSLTAFLNAVSRSPQDGILVLEDYHVIVEPLIHESMALLLEHLPPTLHLIVLSRNDLALPLARLRASGDLCELHAVDLRFSAEEVAAFLQQTLSCDISTVPAELLQQLDTRLEGWASGLRLFTLALHGNADRQQIEHALSIFVGSHRTLQDYFITEVFALQPEPLQHFLLSTSVLSRLTPSLCDAVTEREDSEQMLATLDREGLFLEALDEAGQWYRYHALFAEAMRVEARRRLGEDGLRRLSSKASLWYAEHGMLADAIEAALQAEDMTRSADLIEQLAEKQWSTPGVVPVHVAYEFHTVCRWLEQLPETLLQRYPTLCFLYATALLFVFIMDKSFVEPSVLEHFDWALRMAEEGWRGTGKLHGLANVLAFRAMMSRQSGDFAQAVPWARQALAWLSERDVMWRAICLGVVAHDALLNGRLDEAREVALEAYAVSEKTGSRPFIRANTVLLGMLCFEQGELHMAAEYYHRMMSEAREADDLDDTAQAALGLAQLSYEWNDFATAEQQAQETLTLGQQLSNHEFQAQSTLVLARIAHARGQTAAAQQRYVSLLARLSPHSTPLQRWLARLAQAMLARLALAVGDHSFVQRWLSNCAQDDDHEIPLLVREQEALVEARWLLAQNKEDEALDLLARLLNAAQQNGRMRVALEIQVLMALVHAARKQLHEARSLLQTVLAQAAVEGYLRLFLDEGAKLVPLLRSLSSFNEPSLNTYLQTLLHAFAQGIQPPSAIPAATSLIEPLSPQELRVLRLLAAGRANREIADELVVSVNTVRTQVQSIYRKLNVNNRVAASEVARQLQLL